VEPTNVGVVEDAWAAWERRDWDWMIAHAHPDCEIAQPPQLPDASTYRGHQGLLEAFRDWPEQWDEFRPELLEVTELNPNQVLALTSQHLRARDIAMDQEVAFLLTLRDGKLERWEMFLTEAEALEAAD
jgi:ketosteroid isomerase-like protein